MMMDVDKLAEVFANDSYDSTDFSLSFVEQPE